MAFTYCHTIHFKDTDAAGVVYFANVLSICHEAYEASLAATGFDLRQFFGKGDVAVPISHAEVDFRKPLRCGDVITVYLTTQTLDIERFSTHYQVFDPKNRVAAIARIDHICINARDRRRCPLPQALQDWLHIHGAAAPSPVADGG